MGGEEENRSLKKCSCSETGQLSVNTPIMLLRAGPSCALSTGRMQEVFHHMHLTLFANSFSVAATSPLLNKE